MTQGQKICLLILAFGLVFDIGNTLNNIWRNVEETSRESFTGNNTLGT